MGVGDGGVGVISECIGVVDGCLLVDDGYDNVTGGEGSEELLH